MSFLEVSDLLPFAPGIDQAKAQEMIDDAAALAGIVAPCINGEDFTNHAAVRAIIRSVVLRWNEAGTGAAQTVTSGPFSQTLDTRSDRRGMFWPSEITQLQSLCSSSGSYTLSLAGD